MEAIMKIMKRNQNTITNPYWFPTIFNELFTNDLMEQEDSMTPAINIKESKEAYTIEVAAPGISKEEYSIRIDNGNNLEIVMEKKNEVNDEEKDSSYLRHEFSYATYHQTMSIPEDVDKENITATEKHGILSITLPKFKEDYLKNLQRIIEIQ